jgi:hypothetical protein
MRKTLTALMLAAILLPATAMAREADVIRAGDRVSLLDRLEHRAGMHAPLVQARLKTERARLLALPADRFAAELRTLLVRLTGERDLRVEVRGA